MSDDIFYNLNNDIMSIIILFLDRDKDCCSISALRYACKRFYKLITERLAYDYKHCYITPNTINTISEKKNDIHQICRKFRTNDTYRSNREFCKNIKNELNKLLTIQCCNCIKVKWIFKYRYLLHNCLNFGAIDSRPYVETYFNDYHTNLKIYIDNQSIYFGGYLNRRDTLTKFIFIENKESYCPKQLYFITRALLTMYKDNIKELYTCYTNLNLNLNILLNAIYFTIPKLTFRNESPTIGNVQEYICSPFYDEIIKIIKCNEKVVLFRLYNEMLQFDNDSLFYISVRDYVLNYIKKYICTHVAICFVYGDSTNQNVMQFYRELNKIENDQCDVKFCKKLNKTKNYRNMYVYTHEMKTSYTFDLFTS